MPSSPYNQELGDPTQAARFDEGKPRVELVPPALIEGAARAFGYGAGKYDPWNWAKGFPPVQPAASLMRHLLAWLDGEDIDPESGLHHFDLIAANTGMLLHFQKHGIGDDLRCQAVLQQQREDHGSQEETEDRDGQSDGGSARYYPHWENPYYWICSCGSFSSNYYPSIGCPVCHDRRPKGRPEDAPDGGLPR